MSDVNPLVTRYPNGISTAVEGSALASFPMSDPTRYHALFDDFDTHVTTDGTTAVWTTTLASTGTAAIAAANNGSLVITNANTDEDYNQAQMTTASWLPSVSKKFWMKARVKVSDADKTDCFIGLAAIDTTLIAASAIGVTDAIGFFKAATDTTWTSYVRKDATTGSTSSSAVGSVADDTYTTLGMYYDGDGTMNLYVDDVLVGKIENISSTYWPNAQLSPSIAFGQEGTGGATVGTVDYIFLAAER